MAGFGFQLDTSGSRSPVTGNRPAARAVTLDLWETLITERPGGPGEQRGAGRAAAVKEALARAGLDVPSERIREAFGQTRRAFDADHDSGVDSAFEARVRQMLDSIEPGFSKRLDAPALHAVVSAVDLPFLEYPPEPVEDADRVLAGLADRGLKIGLISNTGFTSAALYRRWFDSLGWLERFSVTSFSNDLEVAKPTLSIFERTLRDLDVDPANALHVGDSGRHDVDGAKRAGMHTVWVRTGKKGTPETTPDFVIDRLGDLLTVVDRWLRGLK